MLSEIKPLLIVAEKLYQQVMLSRANQHQCFRLQERVERVMSALQGLDALPEKRNFKKGLQLLQKTLQESLRFVENFSKKGWFKRIIRAGTDAKRFESLTVNIAQAADLLQLGMVAQQLLNRELDKADVQADQQALLANQAEILRLAKLEYEAIHDMRGDLHILRDEARMNRMEEAECQIVINQQLASIRLQLKHLAQSKPRKRLIRSDLLVEFFDLSFNAILATGTLGKVYTGRWLEQPVAIKMITQHLSDTERKQFAREVDVMSRLRSPYITQLYGACLEPKRACMVMEYMERGALYDAIPCLPITAQERHQMVIHLTRGLYYLHARGVLHLDLSSKNILINAANHIKITDFGFSKLKTKSIETLGEARESALAWMAPERFDRAEENEACDIYSFGMVVWEIMTARRPFEDLDGVALINAVTVGERPSLVGVPDFYAELITRCWAQDPTERPTLQDIIENLESHHPEDTLVQRLPSPTPEARYKQGLAYESERRYDEAAYAYRRAVEKGSHVKASTNLASFFYRGIGGVERNKIEAYQRYLFSAENGHARAQYNLAKMLERGDGVIQDLEEAKRWYQEAADNGNEQAKTKLDSFTHSSDNAHP